jgi:hypothetical protein
MNKEEIINGLANFYGTENWHRFSPLFRKHLLTDGVKWLADNANCYWLMDAICSYHSKCMKDPKGMLQNIQFWTLKVDGNKATLTCERDTDDVAIIQKIEYTDFPLPEIKLYVQPMGDGHFCILLPSEH